MAPLWTLHYRRKRSPITRAVNRRADVGPLILRQR